jgi:L-fucose mutarotase/ribose pyranase (RbsD/FucU family)
MARRRIERKTLDRGRMRGAMLKTLTRLHTPELLHVLASMGHGDELVLVDCHLPAVSNARRLVRLDGADLLDMLLARLQLIPLDTFVKDPALKWKSPTPPILFSKCRRSVSR